MTWIKICGTTNLEDALMAIEAGADALGFVFHEKSPRYVDAAKVEQIIEKLPPQVEKVGVFVGWTEANFNLAGRLPITAMQVHLKFDGTDAGQNPLTAIASSPFPKRVFLVFPAMPLITGESRVDFASFGRMSEVHSNHSFSAIFLDSSTATKPGGTGQTFDWEKAAPLVQEMQQHVKAVIAGGLNPGNVADAMRILKPWGVDVVSGVEASPGKKDPAKVKAFIQTVRQADGARTT